MRHALLVAAVLALTGCPSRKPPVPEEPQRCEVNLDALDVFSQLGTGAKASVLPEGSTGIGGQMSVGSAGDFLLENDKVRVVIQKPGRSIGHIPYGGLLIDADVKRAAGEAGRDQLGKMGMIYNFGRVVNTQKVEVIDDGSKGGPAVIAATGTDALNDYVNVQMAIDAQELDISLVLDPTQALPVQVTTYYVLSPGESRVRILSSFCNRGDTNIITAVGDVFEQGGNTDFINPEGCTKRPGNDECVVDPAPWFGYQGDAVAYGYRTYRFDALKTPDVNALLDLSGTVFSFAGGKDLQSVLAWVDVNATNRPGAFGIRSGDVRHFLRDLVIARDLGSVTSIFNDLDDTPTGRLSTLVTDSDGTTPVPGARVAVVAPVTDRTLTLLVADAEGRVKVDLPAAAYRLVTGVPGRATTALEVNLPINETTSPALRLAEGRTLEVNVKDGSGQPLPARVTVFCPGGPCGANHRAYAALAEQELLPSNVMAFAFVPPSGTLALPLPPGSYEVLVSRGPEYSVWPDTWPTRAEPVDLTAANAKVDATIGQVVDTAGWLSADLHVHGVNSADSAVPNERRVMGFLAEGVDVLVGTDHDFITDYSPVVEALGAQALIRTVIGSEVTPSYAHHNAFPAIRNPLMANGGAFDWADGENPGLRMAEMYQGIRAAWPGAFIQMNHARSATSTLNTLKVDTATGASHADPATFRLAPHPNATPTDTKLFSDAFDALEVQNGNSPSNTLLNDWMTFLSRGSLKTATAVSDTHHAFKKSAGQSRTYVRVPGSDTPATFSQDAFIAALKGRRAMGTNGPFLKVTAQRLDGAGAPVGTAVEIGETISVASSTGEKLRLNVDVQAPEWMKFDSIEIYTHAEGREAVNGVPNETWPASRIHQSKKLDAATLPLEQVPGSLSLRRVHVTESFDVSPTHDTWFVVIVRSSSSVASLFPLAYGNVSCDSDTGLCSPSSGRPSAFSNPIFVDGDGSGAYDDFPLKISQGLSIAPPPAAPTRKGYVPTVAEALELGRRLKHHDD